MERCPSWLITSPGLVFNLLVNHNRVIRPIGGQAIGPWVSKDRIYERFDVISSKNWRINLQDVIIVAILCNLYCCHPMPSYVAIACN